MSNEYQWRTGSVHKVAADVAGPELNRLASIAGGSLKPADVVRHAADEASPLHDEFEWRDDEAAAKYRIVQARQLLNSLVVIRKENPTSAVRFLSVVTKQRESEDQPSQVYHRTEDVLRDPDLRQQLLERAKREAKTFRIKYQHLQELAEVFRTIDEL